MSTAGGVCILSSLASSIVSYMQGPMLLLKCTCLSTGPAFVCFALVGFLGNEIDPSPRSGVDMMETLPFPLFMVVVGERVLFKM
jgi:hypothetical protein